MATKKATKKKSAAKKSCSSGASKKSSGKKFRTKRDSRGIIDKATKVVRSVVVAAVAGAADAVKGVAEAGSKITGIGSPTEDKSKSPKR